jgi:hypothetical protein
MFEERLSITQARNKHIFFPPSYKILSKYEAYQVHECNTFFKIIVTIQAG